MFKQALNGRLIDSMTQENKVLTRPLFSWLTAIFNRVDSQRIKEVGPDHACAEWLLKNGAYVKWQNCSEYLTNYDVLMESEEQHYIQGVKGINASISYEGFPYFDGCKHIQEVKLINCRYICNKALAMLSNYLTDTLCHLEVIGCPGVTDEGLMCLKKLEKLKILKLGGMPYLKDPEAVRRELTESLPDAEIKLK